MLNSSLSFWCREENVSTLLQRKNASASSGIVSEEIGVKSGIFSLRYLNRRGIFFCWKWLIKIFLYNNQSLANTKARKNPAE